MCHQVRNVLHEHTHCQYQDSTSIMQIVRAMSTWQANVRDCAADSCDDTASNAFIQDHDDVSPLFEIAYATFAV